MSLFKRKKKNLFGDNIEPACNICRYAEITENEDVLCILKKGTDKVCKKYEYDPLKRVPKSIPLLKSFTTDDFSIE